MVDLGDEGEGLRKRWEERPMFWYAVNTKPRQEKVAQQNLGRLGVEVFCPLLKQNKLIRRKRQAIVGPLFPGYLFVRFDPEIHCRAVNFAWGVRRVVSFGDEPAVVDEAIIVSIQGHLEDGCVTLSTGPLQPGQRVRIEEGPLRGLEAVFEQELPNHQRVALLLQAVSYQARVVVDLESVVSC